jgi:hypothetical protein
LAVFRRVSHFLGDVAFLPLLHLLVEERVGERRLRVAAPLSLSLSPLRGARGFHRAMSY